MKLLPGILRARGYTLARNGARWRVAGVGGECDLGPLGLWRIVRSGARKGVR